MYCTQASNFATSAHNHAAKFLRLVSRTLKRYRSLCSSREKEVWDWLGRKDLQDVSRHEHSPSASSLPIFGFLTIWLDLLLLNAAAQADQRLSPRET